jgi:hypothetical protein
MIPMPSPEHSSESPEHSIPPETLSGILYTPDATVVAELKELPRTLTEWFGTDVDNIDTLLEECKHTTEMLVSFLDDVVLQLTGILSSLTISPLVLSAEQSSIRKQEHTTLIHVLQASRPYIAKMQEVYLGDRNVLLFNREFCTTAIHDIADTAGLHTLADTMADKNGPATCMSDYHDVLHSMPCLLGIRITKAHWNGMTIRMLAPKMNAVQTIASDVSCAICMEGFSAAKG